MQAGSFAKSLGLAKVAHLEIGLCDKIAVLGKDRGLSRLSGRAGALRFERKGVLSGEASG